jgi:hypothetical protein
MFESLVTIFLGKKFNNSLKFGPNFFLLLFKNKIIYNLVKWHAAITLVRDTSDTHISGVLQQQVRGSWQPLGFFSRKLQLAESKYSTFDPEFLAAVTAIRHFRHILEGRDFPRHLETAAKALPGGVLTHPWHCPPCRLATRRLISSRFVWPGLSKDITAWARECATCQQSKIHRHFKVRPEPIPILQCRFAHIHINLVGPLTPSNGFNHILTVVPRMLLLELNS